MKNLAKKHFNYYKLFKGSVAAATLFIYLFVLFLFNTFYNHVHIVHLSISIRRGLSPFSSMLVAQKEKPTWGAAEPRIRACHMCTVQQSAGN